MRTTETPPRIAQWLTCEAILFDYMRPLLSLLLAALAFAQGCSRDDTAIKEFLKIRVANDYLAPYLAGDVDRWMEVFSEDAVAMHDGMPALVGKRAVRGFAEDVTVNFKIEQMDVAVEEVRLGDSWAWTRGTYQATFVPKTESAPAGVAGPHRGKFVLLWERQTDGVWRIIFDMGNDLPAAPAAEQQ